MTTISSAFFIVDNLWAITREVLPLESISREACIFNSVSLSREEVASSRIRIGGFLRKTLAMEILCFCPPEA
jgi:hypothetical protein